MFPLAVGDLSWVEGVDPTTVTLLLIMGTGLVGNVWMGVRMGTTGRKCDLCGGNTRTHDRVGRYRKRGGEQSEYPYTITTCNRCGRVPTWARKAKTARGPKPVLVRVPTPRKMNPAIPRKTRDREPVKARMLLAQGWRCALCGLDLTTVKPHAIHLDHDRSCCPQNVDVSCGRCDRAVLCNWCNGMIGLAFDSPAVLARAIEYVKGDRVPPTADVRGPKPGMSAHEWRRAVRERVDDDGQDPLFGV